jgi:hypothetical protein
MIESKTDAGSATAARTAARSPAGRSAAAASGGPLGAVLRAIGSFGAAVVLLLILFVLTLLGTLEQQYASLYDVQRKYFESLVLVHDFGPFSLPLPGASLVIGLLSVSLIVGGVIRLRKRTATLGVLVAHLGILLLFAGGLLETLASDKGQMTLYEGSSASHFQSYYEWEISLTERREVGAATEHVLGHDALGDLRPDDVARFTSARLPFDVKVSGWQRNAVPRAVGFVSGTGEVGGWVLEALPPAQEAERNVPGAYVTLVAKGGAAAPGGVDPRGILWGGQSGPWVTTVGGRRFEVDLRTRRWQLPFSVTLDRFVHRRHPGTSMPSEFSSYVTQAKGGVSVERHITMNEPLRDQGYTLYQSGWGPQDAPEGAPLFSTFSVVRNPADRVPLIACLVIAAGLLLHFGRKLFLHIQAQSRSAPSRAAARPA